MYDAEAIKQELIKRYQHELLRRGAMERMEDFVLYTFPSFQMGWFHKEVCAKLDQFLQDVIDRKSPRLIICAPPRHGKSEPVSRRFPAYALGRFPTLEIMACSYSAELSNRMSRDVQSIIDDLPYHDIFPNIALQGSQFAAKGGPMAARTADYFELVGHKGRYRCAGVGGSITGMGADILTIDDPFKDRESANSPTIRGKVWDWFTSTAYTRLAPGGGAIIMCTRWHEDDLVGRLLRNAQTGEGEQYVLVNYPAIAEVDEEHRKQGEALHPDRFPLDALERIRLSVGSRDWAALYQQRPVPDGGGLFKESWIRYYKQSELPARFDKMCISWDMTFKDSKHSDYVVGQVWGRRGSSFYLIDQVRGQWDFVKTVSNFVSLANKHPEVTRKLVEDKANGPAVISALRKDVAGIIPITPKESKEARASAVSTFWEAGNVYLPDPSTSLWVGRDFVPELLSFPAGVHDDQVDAMTQAISDLKAGAMTFHESNLAYLQAIA